MSQPPLAFSRGALVRMDAWYPLSEQKPAEVTWQESSARKLPRHGIFWRWWIGSDEWKKRWGPLSDSGDDDEPLLLCLLLGGEQVVTTRYVTTEVEPADVIWGPADSPDGQPAESPVAVTRALLPEVKKLPAEILLMRQHFLMEAWRSGQAKSRGEDYEVRPFPRQHTDHLSSPLRLLRGWASAGLTAAQSLWKRLQRGRSLDE